MNPSGQCLTWSYLSLPRKMIIWKRKTFRKIFFDSFQRKNDHVKTKTFRKIFFESFPTKNDHVKRKTFRERMTTAAQPTVLDRLKERLVVALGKSQDKRVERKYKSEFSEEEQNLFQVCRMAGGRIEDQLPPPCSPARRPRSSSVCRYLTFSNFHSFKLFFTFSMVFLHL